MVLLVGDGAAVIGAALAVKFIDHNCVPEVNKIARGRYTSSEQKRNAICGECDAALSIRGNCLDLRQSGSVEEMMFRLNVAPRDLSVSAKKEVLA